jgi:NAD(P)-dependent dehydrogenase (short-subunit alcohol dehydrogenase family)
VDEARLSSRSLPKSPHAVITGAASGFGRALALVLAERGATLVLGDLDEAGLRETVDLVLAKGARAARGVRCDVTRLESVQALAGACESEVDLVVNNAGVSSGGAVGQAPIEDWRWTLEVNLFGVLHGCHVFVPILLAQGHGHVLNVASAAGLLSPPRMGAYNVSKAGVVALSETLAAEFEGTRVGVTVLCPTFFRTNICKNGRFPDERTRKTAEKLVNEGRSAEEVARAALASVERGRLYSVPMSDGRMFWRMKRLMPESFRRAAGKMGRRFE